MARKYQGMIEASEESWSMKSYEDRKRIEQYEKRASEYYHELINGIKGQLKFSILERLIRLDVRHQRRKEQRKEQEIVEQREQPEA